jgi:uncharacterized protein YdhG (YjbR/CyaY superfamily)
MSPAPKNVDDYIASAPDETRAPLTKLRSAVRGAAPDAVESIAYQMPAYKYKGKVLIYFGAAKHHVAVYGASMEAHAREFAAYSTSKGTIRFPLDKPIPTALVKKLVKTRMSEIESRKK